MLQRTLAALGVIAVILAIVGVGIAISQHSNRSSQDGHAEIRSPAPSVAVEPTLHPLEDATPTISTQVNPSGLTIPAGAKLATEAQVISFASNWAKQDGAVKPELVELRLETLQTALETTDKQIGTDPRGAMSAQKPTDAKKPVWRVLFNGTVRIPSCPVPDNAATPDDCGTTSSVEYVIDPMDASEYSATYGARPLPSATP